MDGNRFDNEQLLTSRLSLDRPTPDDIDAIYRVNGDPAACRHNPSDRLTSRGEADDLYSRWDAHWNRHGFGYWAVHHRPGHQPRKPVGFCGLKLMRLHDRDILNLFYRLEPAAWGSGVATEAAATIVAWARAHIPDRPIVARVRPDNVASARVALRAGLDRAQHLDTAGEDGLDWIFVANWPMDAA